MEHHRIEVFDVDVKRFEANVKVPHMGWNLIENLKSELFIGLETPTYMYAVHSYYAPKCDFTIATSNYDIDFSSALQKDNFSTRTIPLREEQSRWCWQSESEANEIKSQLEEAGAEVELETLANNIDSSQLKIYNRRINWIH